MSLIQTAALMGSLAASVAAHGHVQGIVAAGVYYQGYDPSFQYANPAPVVIGWSDPEDLGNGFIPPSNYSTADIICHLGATPGGTAAKVAPGDVVELQWTDWPESHHGPVIDYLAKVSGEFSDVDKTTLEFFKIDEVGLVDDTTVPGIWGSDQLIANNNSWAVTIPKDIAPGNYVLRHEIIALHSAGQADGAQNYPQCINLEVSGTGTATPSGTVGEKLYTDAAAPGVVVNIYQSLSTYEIPGPTLYSGAISAAQSTVAAGSAAPVATGSSSAYDAPASTTAAASSAAPTSAAPVTSAAPSTPSTTSVAPPTTAVQVATSAAPTTASAPPAYSASAESSAASAIAPIVSIATGIPSSILTQTIPTALPWGIPGAAPTAGALSATANHTYGGVPSKPLPEGFTLKDLLEWVAYLLKKGGNHQRDFSAARK